MDQREKFEAWADGAGFGLKYRESMFAAWEGALAASAPVVAMTDDEAWTLMVSCIGTQSIGWAGATAVCIEGPRDAGEVYRSIEARSGVNAQLVEALKAILLDCDPNSRIGTRTRNALAAAGVDIPYSQEKKSLK